MLDPTWIVVWAVLTVGSALQSSIGIGLGVLAAPLLLLLRPELVPAPLLIANLVQTTLMLARDRRGAHVRGIGLAIAGRVPGAIVGAVLVASLARAPLDLVLGCLLLAMVALATFGRGLDLRPTPPVLLAAGCVSGVTGTAVSVGGPPIALVYRNEQGERLRGTMGGYFVVGACLSLTALWGVGELGPAQLLGALGLIPPIVLGFVVSAPLARRLEHADRLRLAISLVSAVAAALVAVRGLLGVLG